jgi:alkylation response protein AidB-like acyl-CoA dehydrogenase
MSLLLNERETNPYVETAALIAREFAKDAAERDKSGGTPIRQLQLLRESGLLKLLIPHKYGGDEQPWSVILRIIREFAKTDASLAHIYGYHFLPLTRVFLVGTPEQQKFYYMETVKNNWFWGNSGNLMDRRLTGRRDGDRYIVNGVKGFSSGSPGSDYLAILWLDEQTSEWVYGAVPTNRKGITVHEDWDGFGQRQTGSGTVTYENVILHTNEILESNEYKDNPFSKIVALLSLSILTNVFIGSSKGAIDEAREYTLTKSRPWIDSGVDKPADDPSILRQYGELWIQTEAAEGLADKASNQLDHIWSKGFTVTAEERGEVAVTIATANVFAGNTALEVTNRMFDVMGARSATTRNGFDRYWRNVRTHTLHNPAEYKLRNVGRWVLTGQYPTPGYYS